MKIDNPPHVWYRVELPKHNIPPYIGPLHIDDARILAKLSRELTVTYIDSVNARSAPGKKAICKTAGGSACVQDYPSADINSKGVESG